MPFKVCDFKIELPNFNHIFVTSLPLEHKLFPRRTHIQYIKGGRLGK